MGFRSDFYYTAARDRIKEAQFLHENRYYVLAMYVSGREIFSSSIVKHYMKRRKKLFNLE